MRRAWWVPLVAGLLAFASCKDEMSDFSVQVVTRIPEVADWSAMTVEVRGPELSRVFRRSDFTPVAGSSTQFRTQTVLFHGSGSATLTVRFVSVSQAGGAGVEVGATFPVQPDWGYGASVFIGGPRPAGIFCGQVAGAAALPAVTAESLFVVTGGSPRDAVC